MATDAAAGAKRENKLNNERIYSNILWTQVFLIKTNSKIEFKKREKEVEEEKILFSSCRVYATDDSLPPFGLGNFLICGII